MPVSVRVTLGGRRLTTLAVGSAAATTDATKTQSPVAVGVQISAVSNAAIRAVDPVWVRTRVPDPYVIYDYYVQGSGSDNNLGTSWSEAFKTFQKAADTAPSGSRIWVAPETYTVSSTVTYSGKNLLWIGPERTSGQLQGQQGAVYLTGSGLTRFFNISDATGGGMEHFTFDVTAISSDAVRINDVTHFVMDHPYLKTNSNTADYNRPLLRVIGNTDVSHLVMYHPETRSAPILYASLSSGTKAHGWRIQTGEPKKSHLPSLFAQPSIDISGGEFDGLVITGGYYETSTSPTIKIDLSSGTGTRRVFCHGLGFERCDVPAVRLYNTRASVHFGGGHWNHNGSYWGSSTIEGYCMAPNAYLSGDLVAGVN